MSREPRIPGLRRVFRLPAGAGRSVEREVDDEVRFHIETRVEALVSAGVSPAAAREQALAEFGSVDAARRELAAIDRRRLGRRSWRARLEAIAHDLRLAVRGLRREPGLALAVVVTLGLGIGANAVMFGVVDRLLLAPPAHVVDADRVVRVYIHRVARRADVGGGPAAAFPQTNYASYRDLARTPSFAATAFYTTDFAVLGHGPSARPLTVVRATATLFPLLGIRPHIGRFFTQREDRPGGAADVLVLSHDLWRRAFGADPAVVGRTVQLGGKAHLVLGVAPEGYTGIESFKVDAWAPITPWLGPDQLDNRNWFGPQVVARLRPGADRARAAAEATTLYRRGNAETPYPSMDPSDAVRLGSILSARAALEVDAAGGSASPGGEPLVARVTLWLLGVAGVVLLVACVNVAGLLLGRSVRRRRETAVRLALGVGRGRLLAALLTEGVLLAALGAAAALAVAEWGGAAARRWLALGVTSGDALNPRVLLVTAVLALATGLLCALAPALQARRTDVALALKGTAREGHHRGSLLRTALLAGQAALLALLLTGAGLFVRSLRNARAEPLGMEIDRVLNVTPSLSHRPPDDPGRRAVWEQALARVRALPGVESAALVSMAPFLGASSYAHPRVPGRDSASLAALAPPYESVVTPEFFGTVGAHFVRGRPPAPGDRGVVVNQTLARQYWPAGEAVGACVTSRDDGRCVPVIGVVSDVLQWRLREEPRGHLYHMASDAPRDATAMLVRTAGDPERVAPAVRRAVHEVDPGIVHVAAAPLKHHLEAQFQSWRMGASVFTAFGALALVLAVVGLYGALAYAVAQRRQEIGVRIALGARPGTLARMVAWQGLRPVLLGLAIGLTTALALGRFVAPLLFDVAPHDPLVLATVAAALLAVSAAASLVPAWRATRVDPAEVLRAE